MVHVDGHACTKYAAVRAEAALGFYTHFEHAQQPVSTSYWSSAAVTAMQLETEQTDTIA